MKRVTGLAMALMPVFALGLWEIVTHGSMFIFGSMFIATYGAVSIWLIATHKEQRDEEIQR